MIPSADPPGLLLPITDELFFAPAGADPQPAEARPAAEDEFRWRGDAALKERIRACAAAGGIPALPAGFAGLAPLQRQQWFRDNLPPGFLDPAGGRGMAAGDWQTVRSTDPFERLYLDGGEEARITSELLDRHSNVLSAFWREQIDSLETAGREKRRQIVERFAGEGGSERVLDRYATRLDDAREQVHSEVGARAFAGPVTGWPDFALDGPEVDDEYPRDPAPRDGAGEDWMPPLPEAEIPPPPFWLRPHFLAAVAIVAVLLGFVKLGGPAFVGRLFAPQESHAEETDGGATGTSSGGTVVTPSSDDSPTAGNDDSRLGSKTSRDGSSTSGASGYAAAHIESEPNQGTYRPQQGTVAPRDPYAAGTEAPPRVTSGAATEASRYTAPPEPPPSSYPLDPPGPRITTSLQSARTMRDNGRFGEAECLYHNALAIAEGAGESDRLPEIRAELARLVAAIPPGTPRSCH